jgi:hypothetical protein
MTMCCGHNTSDVQTGCCVDKLPAKITLGAVTSIVCCRRRDFAKLIQNVPKDSPGLRLLRTHGHPRRDLRALFVGHAGELPMCIALVATTCL